MTTLSNGAPITDAGKLLVTTTTPGPTWPFLGGLAYDPVTFALAVKDAVPAAGDPWNNGIRNTSLGQMYVTSTLPSPLFYAHGLPVSADGRVFASSGAGVGWAPGGWPLGPDGGISMDGLSPQPIFWSVLTNTLVPVIAGNPAFTFSRATTAYVADQDGILRQAIASEARFQGARRVRNWLINSNLVTSWTLATATRTTGIADPLGGTTAITLTANANNSLIYQQPTVAGNLAVNSIWIRRRTGTGTITFHGPDNGAGNINVTGIVTSAWRRISVMSAPGGTVATLAVTLAISGDEVDLWAPQIELVDGQSNQAPGDYVSVGVLAAPYHGNAVDGVKYFATTNGNSVAANIVTEAQGTLIPTATLLGFVAENAATNIVLGSQTFDDGTKWSQDGTTISAVNTQVAPDGTLTADTWNEGVTNAVHRLFSVTTASALVYTSSIYLKRGTLTWIQIAVYPVSGAWGFANLNLVTGAIGNKSAGVTATVTALPNGWFRFSITATFSAAGLTYLGVYGIGDVDAATVNTSYTGANGTVYLWGAQVEQASDPSSYIPTVAVSVTRNGDDLRYQVASNLNGSLATTYAEVTTPAANTIDRSIFFYQSDALAPQYIEGSTKRLRINSAGGGPSTVNALAVGVTAKTATAWSGATTSLCLNGGAVATGAFTAFGNVGALSVGWSFGSNAMQGSIRNVKFYNVRIADADLAVMTGP